MTWYGSCRPSVRPSPTLSMVGCRSKGCVTGWGLTIRFLLCRCEDRSFGMTRTSRKELPTEYRDGAGLEEPD